MMEKFHQLYEKLTNEIEACASSQDHPRKWIECCFTVCAQAWLELKKLFAGHSFQNREQEIEFFKLIKPKFGGADRIFCSYLQVGNVYPRRQKGIIKLLEG